MSQLILNKTANRDLSFSPQGTALAECISHGYGTQGYGFQLILQSLRSQSGGIESGRTACARSQECFGSSVGCGLHELLNSELISHAPTPGCPGGRQGKAVPIHCCSMAQT